MEGGVTWRHKLSKEGGHIYYATVPHRYGDLDIGNVYDYRPDGYKATIGIGAEIGEYQWFQELEPAKEYIVAAIVRHCIQMAELFGR